MDRVICHELPELFQGAADILEKKREELYEMDARMGDRDLSLAMQKSFGILPQLIQDSETEGDIGKTFMEAGMKMVDPIPSTMGILTPNGIMEGGEAIGRKGGVGPKELTELLAGFARRAAHRRRCQLGDRTTLDTVDAGAKKAQETYAKSADMGAMFRRTAESAKEGVKAIEDMLPRYGEAIVFSTKARGVPDQGTAAGQYFLGELGRYFLGNLK